MKSILRAFLPVVLLLSGCTSTPDPELPADEGPAADQLACGSEKAIHATFNATQQFLSGLPASLKGKAASVAFEGTVEGRVSRFSFAANPGEQALAVGYSTSGSDFNTVFSGRLYHYELEGEKHYGRDENPAGAFAAVYGDLLGGDSDALGPVEAVAVDLEERARYHTECVTGAASQVRLSWNGTDEDRMVVTMDLNSTMPLAELRVVRPLVSTNWRFAVSASPDVPAVDSTATRLPARLEFAAGGETRRDCVQAGFCLQAAVNETTAYVQLQDLVFEVWRAGKMTGEASFRTGDYSDGAAIFEFYDADFDGLWSPGDLMHVDLRQNFEARILDRWAGTYAAHLG